MSLFLQAPPPKPARRQGGWAEESSGSGSAKYVSLLFPLKPQVSGICPGSEVHDELLGSGLLSY